MRAGASSRTATPEEERGPPRGGDGQRELTAVSHQIAAAVRIAHLHRAVKDAAGTDALTELPNRRVFFERLELALAEARRTSSPLTVAVVDVNELKRLNDEHGHATGDAGLVRVGRVLAEGVRGQDLVARIGGDEFAIVFVGAPILVAERVMRRVAETIRSARLEGGVAVPSIAWGLAEAIGPATADQAMYRHKQRSRQRSTA